MLDRVPRLGDSLRSVGPTVGANLVNQAVVALTQLAVIPLLVSRWGVEGFGTWLLLTAIPTYLTISDFGFTTSAKTDMAIRAKRGDVAGAKVTASSVAALLIVALAAVAVIYLAVVAFVDWTRALNLTHITQAEAQEVLCLGLIQLASYQAFLLSASVIRAAGRPALEVLLAAGFRAAETTALIVTALFGGGFVAAACAWAATRFATTLVLWVVLSVRLPELVPARSGVRWGRVRMLLKPSVAYLLVPLANAIFIQGTVLVLGAVTGPALVAAYSTMRVVTRLGVSAANVLNYAFTPQYSYAVGANANGSFVALWRSHVGLILVGVLAYSLLMALAGPWLVHLLSHGKVDSDPTVLLLLTAAAAFEMLWGVALSIGSATNTVGRLSIALLILSILSLAVIYLFSAQYSILGASAAIASSQLLMIGVAIVWWLDVRQKERGQGKALAGR